MRYSFVSKSPEDTLEFGVRLGKQLGPGDVVCLEGELGAGKTVLTVGIAKGLGIKTGVTSPTFTIINEYPGEIPLYHIDLYRLEDGDEFYYMGGEDLMYGQGVSVIE
ncbi:MAG TPA: tRNA (adenosine(37)-N6)-threonylcarbamoyltransferase complex ATPase subunit type 1 TsaE [Bacillota bacterium]|nr:tRNA (adenosine(37)-N6)-threonylcarbamoyltransferase complex ATPase subunit type 1 TsaE [Bacillota bacterium]